MMSAKYKDLTGQRYGYLIVISDAGWSVSGQHQSNVECDCGNKKIAANANLKNGSIKSCGDLKNCPYAIALKSAAQTTHGLTNTLEYCALANIKARCTNSNSKYYVNYGGRGITLYSAWFNFEIFKDYIDNDSRMPETLLQFQAKNPGKRSIIDRIDNDKNYEPGNIRWVTDYESMQNTTFNVLTVQLVKFVRWEYKINNKTVVEIFKILKTNYNYQGSRTPIYDVIKGISWPNINIGKELVEYNQFGTINGVIIINGNITPDIFKYG